MWGIRITVPARLLEKVLEELHRVHMGIAKAKALARNHVWWPGIDAKIEQITKSCERWKDVKLSGIHRQQHPSIRGVGDHTHGNEYTSILLVPSSKRCFLYWLTHIPSGLKLLK